MSRNAQIAALMIGTLMLATGTVLSVVAHGGGIGLMIMGALVIASLALERRYGRPGALTTVPDSAWELTGEKFLDDESGQPLEVWMDPLTGERRYQPMAGDPLLPRN